MMNRRLLITSALLVVGYSVVCYISESKVEKNLVLKHVISEMLEEEKEALYALRSVIREESKRSTNLSKLSDEILDEVEFIMEIGQKEAYINTGYMHIIFEKFGIDQELLELDLSDDFVKYQLQASINTYLSDHIELLEKYHKPNQEVKMRLWNRHESYQVNEIHKLNFQFYESIMESHAVKHYYEINGEKKRIESLPLILDYKPELINFSTQAVDLVTGETKTYKSRYTP